MKRSIHLPDAVIEKCSGWAKKVTDYFTRNGDRITAMPWTRNLMTHDELGADGTVTDDPPATIPRLRIARMITFYAACSPPTGKPRP
jgi:hypothetical protein